MPARRARRRSISSQNWARDSGSTPVVGSSSTSRSGSWISAQHKPQLLFHAAREFACGAVAERCQTGAFEQFGNALMALGLLVTEQTAEEIDVFEYRQREIEVLAQPLRHVSNAWTDSAAMRGVGDVAAQHLDTALLHFPRAGQQRHQAGFAHAVGADQAHHAVGGNIQAEIVEGKVVAIAQTDILHADDGLRQGCRCSLRQLDLKLRRPRSGRIELDVGHAGHAGLDLFEMLFQQFGIDPCTHAEHQLQAFALGLHRFRRELGDAGDETGLGRDHIVRQRRRTRGGCRCRARLCPRLRWAGRRSYRRRTRSTMLSTRPAGIQHFAGFGNTILHAPVDAAPSVRCRRCPPAGARPSPWLPRSPIAIPPPAISPPRCLRAPPQPGLAPRSPPPCMPSTRARLSSTSCSGMAPSPTSLCERFRRLPAASSSARRWATTACAALCSLSRWATMDFAV